MSVKAKFRVSSMESTLTSRAKERLTSESPIEYEAVEMKTIVLDPVYGNGDPEHENTKFWNASPSGQVRLGTVNPEAWQYFELGAEYYLDFTKAEKEQSASA